MIIQSSPERRRMPKSNASERQAALLASLGDVQAGERHDLDGVQKLASPAFRSHKRLLSKDLLAGRWWSGEVRKTKADFSSPIARRRPKRSLAKLQ
jgi:hypothetical protein